MTSLLSKRERLTLFITLGLIIFAISFNFVIAPILTKNANLNQEINLTQAKLKKYLWLLSQKDYIQAKFSKFSFLPEVLSEQKDVLLGALSELENLAKNTELKIIEIRPQTSQGLELHQEITIDLRTEGTMENYFNFIYHLESSPLLLRIKKFQLNLKPASQLLEGNFALLRLTSSE